MLGFFCPCNEHQKKPGATSEQVQPILLPAFTGYKYVKLSLKSCCSFFCRYGKLKCGPGWLRAYLQQSALPCWEPVRVAKCQTARPCWVKLTMNSPDQPHWPDVSCLMFPFLFGDTEGLPVQPVWGLNRYYTALTGSWIRCKLTQSLLIMCLFSRWLLFILTVTSLSHKMCLAHSNSG